MIYLLDSNIIIDVLNRRRGRDLLVTDVVTKGNIIAGCPINVIEVYSGLRPDEEENARAFMSELEYYQITYAIAEQAGRMRCRYRREGITLSLPDATIAAVAIAHDLTLITDNVKDYPMPELRLYPLSK
jgi:hypothetical protein